MTMLNFQIVERSSLVTVAITMLPNLTVVGKCYYAQFAVMKNNTLSCRYDTCFDCCKPGIIAALL